MHRLDGLNDRRAAILDRWKALTLAVYPERSQKFIVTEPDRFQNPVGHVVAENLEILYDGLLEGVPPEEMRAALDGIVRIRAVQDLSPSSAVGFVFLLKQAIREELSGTEPASGVDRSELFERIDRLALLTFDLFIQCREQIYDLRLREIRGRNAKPLALRRASAERERSESDTRGGCTG
jgi:hypothetical protein